MPDTQPSQSETRNSKSRAPYYFCTYFDRNYLVRGLTLFRSLSNHAEPFVLWVLCFDDFTYNVLSKINLPNLKPISLREFEHGDNALLAAKQNRSRVEYYFTCTPSLSLYILNKFPEADLITYLDADLFFYSDPTPIYEELAKRSVLIVEHRFPEHVRHDEEKFGIYNVGFASFRNDMHGRQCLQWWRERCIEWCYDRAEEGLFADQKYLDDWPDRFREVVVLQHKGGGLAPWNWMNYDIQFQDGTITVDGDRLIFFHFHHLKAVNWWMYDTGLSGYKKVPFTLRRRIYVPYVRALQQTLYWVRRRVPEVDIGRADLRNSKDYNWWTVVKRFLRSQIIVSVGSFAL